MKFGFMLGRGLTGTIYIWKKQWIYIWIYRFGGMLLTKFLGMPFVCWAVRKAEKKSGWLDLHSQCLGMRKVELE